MEPQHIARIIAAALLLTAWLVRRDERELVLLAISYLGLALGSMACSFATATEDPMWIQLAALGPAIYAGCLWMVAAEQDGRASKAAMFLVIVGVSTLVFLATEAFRPDLLSVVAGLIVSPISAWCSYRLWRKANSIYRGTAAMLAIQAALLLLGGLALQASAGLRIALAVTYALAAASIAYCLLRESAASLEKYREFDELTGFPNRRLVVEHLGRAIDSAVPSSFVGVIFTEVHGIDRVNQMLGHAEGDELLQLTASRLQGLCEPGTTIGRYGASDLVFVVCTSESQGAATMERLAERIVASLRCPIGALGRDYSISARVGLQIAGRGRTAHEHIKLAGLAAAACDSHSGWRYFDAGIHERATRHLAVERGLRRALQQEELTLVYQPIVASKSHAVIKAEALLRWYSEELGDVSPAEFIPIAESTGLICEIGGWALNQACAQGASWLQSFPGGIVVSVNVAAAQLQRPDFLGQVMEALQRHMLPPRLLELELTESAMPLESPAVRQAFSELRELGVRIALDDFGTGYSSLARLAQVDLDTLKIDRSFVRDIECSARARSLCEATCTIGRQLNLQIVAEGVETNAQAEILTDFGVDFLQGYLLGRPQPPERLRPTIGSSRRAYSDTPAFSVLGRPITARVPQAAA